MSSGLSLVSYREFFVESDILLPAQEFTAPACLVFTNFDRINPSFAALHRQNLYVAGQHRLDAMQLGRLAPQTQIVGVGEDDAVPVLGQAVLREQFPPYFAAADIDKLVPTTRAAERIAPETVLIGRYGVRTWGHWLAELLPKIVAVEHRFPGRFSYALPSLLAHDPAMRPMRESLAYYGIAIERLVLLAKDTSYTGERLFWASPAWTGSKFHPGAAALLRDGRRNHRTMPTPSRVALLRTESNTRTVANVADIAPLLKDAGFALLEIGNLPFAEQVQIFTNASHLAGVLGSGLTGLMYSPRDVEVMILAPGSWGDSLFYALMQERNARLVDIRGKQDSTDTRSSMYARFVVAAADVSEGLAHLSSGPPVPPLAEDAAAAGASKLPELEILAHIQHIGDRRFAMGTWVGSPDAGRSIEGFAIFARAGIAATDIRYRAVLRDGSLSEWCAGGQFCGSRGQHEPIRGICVELLGRAGELFDCRYAARFGDDTRFGPLRHPEVCLSPGLAHVLAFRLTLRPRADDGRRTRVPQRGAPSLPRPPSICLTVDAAYDTKLRGRLDTTTKSTLVCLPSAATFIRFLFGNESDEAYALKCYWAPTAQVGNGWLPYGPDGAADPALFAPVTFNGAGADLPPAEAPTGAVVVATIPPDTPAYFSDWMPAFGPLAADDASWATKLVLLRSQTVAGTGYGIRATAGVNHDAANVGGVSAYFASPAGIDALADTGFAEERHTHLLAAQIRSRVPGYTVLYAGSSIMKGTSTVPFGRQNFTRVACRAMTMAGTPFTAVFADSQGNPRTPIIAAAAIARIEALEPDFVLMQVSNRNDEPATSDTQDETWASAMRVADATVRHGGVPILVTGTPWPARKSPDAAIDRIRRLNNDRARASNLPVFDYDALLSDGGTPARLLARYNESGDGTHPGNSGHTLAGEKLAAMFATLIVPARVESTISDLYRDHPPAESSARPDVKHVLAAFDASLRPDSFFEIGVDVGFSAAAFSCDAVCVDPQLDIAGSLAGSRKRTFLFRCDPGVFFVENSVRALFPRGIDIALLAGLHRHAAMLRDFIATERECHARSLIILRDCLPPDPAMAERGDAWRMLPMLKQYRPDLRVEYIDCGPTALVVCGHLDPGSTVLTDGYDRIVEEFARLEFESFGSAQLSALYPTIDAAKALRRPDILAEHFRLR